jgi:hypothetical protein
MRRTGLAVLGALVVAVVLLQALALLAAAGPTAPSFASEQAFPGTGAYWEPTIAVDPSSSYVYQAVTYINASKTCPSCPGTAIFLRASPDGGATWGAAHPIYLAGGKGWQYDPQLKVATDGTVYAVFLQTFDPGSVLFKSTDHGATWSVPYTMNGALTYNDKPILEISPSGQDVYVAFNVKTASYVAVSHDYGQTFIQVKTSNESLWWYTYGGTYNPVDGSAYFAQAGESGTTTNGAGKTITNAGHVGGPQKIFVLKMNHAGTSWTNTYIETSATPTPCAISACYVDYFAAQGSIAADSLGNLMLAYTANAVNGTPHSLFARTSADGVHWSGRILVNSLGDSNFPIVASGPAPGDFRLVWQDNRKNACWNCGGLHDWNTWYTRTTNDGGKWTADVRLSDLGSGAWYKTALGYDFTDGDYFGLAVNQVTGVNYVIWGEADGSSIYCCGGAWYTSGV